MQVVQTEHHERVDLMAALFLLVLIQFILVALLELLLQVAQMEHHEREDLRELLLQVVLMAVLFPKSFKVAKQSIDLLIVTDWEPMVV